jgi:hypothetical protein
MFRVKDAQNFGAGLTFIVIGIVGLAFGRDYAYGSIARMGPGYFPWMLSLGLIAIGGFIGVRALAVEGPAIPLPRLRSALLVLAAIILFGLLIERAGLFPTVAVCTFLTAFATDEARPLESAVLALGLAGFVTLLFIYGLNQPIKPFWFG